MKATGVVAGTIIWTVVVAAGLSASSQSGDAQGSRPAGEVSQPARVITELPSVTFGGAPTVVQTKFKPRKIRTIHADRWPGAGQQIEVTQPQTRQPGEKQTICGLTMIEQSPEIDARILLPPDRSAGAAVRRIEPQTCTPDRER